MKKQITPLTALLATLLITGLALAATAAIRMNGAQLNPQSSCPIASGANGIWVDSGVANTLKFRKTDGTDTVFGAASTGNWTFSGNIADLSGAGTMQLGSSNASVIQFQPGGVLKWLMSGSDLKPNASGGSNIGTALLPLGIVYTKQYAGGGSAPSVAVGAAAGSGATVSLTGTDSAYEVTLNTGTGTAAAGTLFTVTYNGTFASTPYTAKSASTSTAGNNLWDAYVDRAASSTTTMVFKSSLTVPTASATFKIMFITVQ